MLHDGLSLKTLLLKTKPLFPSGLDHTKKLGSIFAVWLSDFFSYSYRYKYTQGYFSVKQHQIPDVEMWLYLNPLTNMNHSARLALSMNNTS